ncbi:MAG: sensor histidine kinase, partial [Bacteroidota bacterium]
PTAYYLYRRRLKERKMKEGEIKRAQLEASEEEKLRVSRELHDSMGGRLTLLSMMIDMEMAKSPENEQLGVMRESTQTAINELRNICRNIYPQNLLMSGLSESINQLFEKVNSVQKEIQFSTVFPEHTYDQGLSISIYRIVQELINNTLKYSKATAATLDAEITDDDILRISYSDNGVGMDPMKAKFGIGMNSILERTKAYGGEVKIVAEKERPSVGFYIRFEFPLQQMITNNDEG